jgi:membrane protease YdiL (CAAX protease family)
MVFAGFLSSLRGTASVPETGPLAFLAFLGVGLYLMQRFAFDLWPCFPTRTAAAVWSSSALFAVAHSGVWPSPIPLFAFALGLGYLTARTRDITTAVVVHGMFNAVSFVYLLRGGS